MTKPDETTLEYSVVSDTDFSAFRHKVETQCNDEGWQLQGGVCVTSYPVQYGSGGDYHTEIEFMYAQALVRQKPEESA
jgi:hypothetical protein